MYENAAAGIEGLPVREEVCTNCWTHSGCTPLLPFLLTVIILIYAYIRQVFRFEKGLRFFYEKRQGFEGQKLERKFHTSGEYAEKGNCMYGD